MKVRTIAKSAGNLRGTKPSITARTNMSEGMHTLNTAENFFSIFKRGMRGVYQHCGEKHLHRYLAEFDFRYSNRVSLGINDESRTRRTLKGIVGKRLTYRARSEIV